MKVMYCQDCGDIIAPYRTPWSPRFCICRRHAVWWDDPQTGEIRVFDATRRMVTEREDEAGTTWTHPHHTWRAGAYILGLTNSWLENPNERLLREDYEAIIEAHPDTYLFKTLRSVAVRIRPGRSSDSQYAELPT